MRLEPKSRLRLPNLLLLGLLALATLPSEAAEAPPYPFFPPYDELFNFLIEDPSPIAVVRELADAGGVPYLASDGRPIRAIKISDNPTVDEPWEPAFLFVGVIHGRERLGARVLLQLVEDLTEQYCVGTDVFNWVNAYEIWIVPVMNPYGYDNDSRKNSKGVDLNRNFGWAPAGSFDGPRPETRWDRCKGACLDRTNSRYRGLEPFSEPESKAIRDLVERERPVFGATFHSGWNVSPGAILRPWSLNDFGDDEVRCDPLDPSLSTDDLVVIPPADSDRLAEFSQVLAQAVSDSRQGARLCDGTSTIAGACTLPAQDTARAFGQSNVSNYALTGMLDYLIETSAELWREDIFNDSCPEGDPAGDCEVKGDPDYNASDWNDFKDAQEYARSYKDGLRALMDQFICSVDPGGFSFTGPGVTGRVVSQDGNPVPATVQVRDPGGSMHDDDRDDDGDVDELDRQVDFDDSACDHTRDPADAAFGAEDILFRTASNDGYFTRLLPQGTYTLEVSFPGYESVSRTVDVNLADGPCLEEVEIRMPRLPTFTPVVFDFAVSPSLTESEDLSRGLALEAAVRILGECGDPQRTTGTPCSIWIIPLIVIEDPEPREVFRVNGTSFASGVRLDSAFGLAPSFELAFRPGARLQWTAFLGAGFLHLDGDQATVPGLGDVRVPARTSPLVTYGGSLLYRVKPRLSLRLQARGLTWFTDDEVAVTASGQTAILEGGTTTLPLVSFGISIGL